MSRRRTREGYLFVKQSGRSAFGKSWKRKWVVVQPNNTRSQVGELTTLSLVLELYMEKGAYGKTVNSVLIEGATEVRRVVSKNQPLAFEVRNKDKVLVTAAGESETESQEWMAMFRQQLLPIIRQKELTRLPEASQDGYKVSVIPNKYSEGLKLSGDMLAHVTSMTFGVYDIHEGTLVKEWDLRHTKRFSLQSKGPTKDVDRIAVIQISNRSPHGEGELLLFSFNAKTFLERIYENLNSAMNVKSKRTRTSSMLFEIPPKELEALGKEIKEEKTATNGAEENGAAKKDEAKEELKEQATGKVANKDQADVGTQLSEKAENEDLTSDQDKEKVNETDKPVSEEGATSPAEEKNDDAKEEKPTKGEEMTDRDAVEANHVQKEDKVDERQEEEQSAETTDVKEQQEEQQVPEANGGSELGSTPKANGGVETNPKQDLSEKNTQQTVVEVHVTEASAENQQEKDQEGACEGSEANVDTTSASKEGESEETPAKETTQEEVTENTVATESAEAKAEQEEDEPSSVTQTKEGGEQSIAVQEETKQGEGEDENSAIEDGTNQDKVDAVDGKTPEGSSVDDANKEESTKDGDHNESLDKETESDSKSTPEETEEVNDATQTENKEGEESDETITGETEEDVTSPPQETEEEERGETNTAEEQENVGEDDKDVHQDPVEESVKSENDEGSIEDQKSSDVATTNGDESRGNEDKADEQVEKNESNIHESAQQVEGEDKT